MDYSHETLVNCIQKILKHSSWRPLTKYYEQNLWPKKTISMTLNGITSDVKICTTRSKYFLLHEIYGVLAVPRFMAQSLLGNNAFTFWIGPYVFINGFETTAQGKYLIKMLEYPKLVPASQRKVDTILDVYKYWVQVDESFMEILKKRDANNKGGYDGI